MPDFQEMCGLSRQVISHGSSLLMLNTGFTLLNYLPKLPIRNYPFTVCVCVEMLYWYFTVLFCRDKITFTASWRHWWETTATLPWCPPGSPLSGEGPTWPQCFSAAWNTCWRRSRTGSGISSSISANQTSPSGKAILSHCWCSAMNEKYFRFVELCGVCVGGGGGRSLHHSNYHEQRVPGHRYFSQTKLNTCCCWQKSVKWYCCETNDLADA